ncbi:hypothetical protein [Streptomyces blattellae]|uniref:hypothetical protein n=1 Tax=Streptomyces blattellae TaxID=2569855 RepID=UPI0012B88D5A|nr:hypothetical protein [Streptomyces blattellae]
MTGDEGVLEQAVAELRTAEAAVIEARRKVTATIIAQRRAGMPVPEIAERTGRTLIDIRNVLNVAGLT